jgi:hypothetical protein
MMVHRQTTELRALLRNQTFLHMPSVYDAIGGRLVQSLQYEAVYVGGYVTGGSSAVTEPLLTMTEQVALAGHIAQSVDLPLIADAGAGFGEPLHTMRTVREFIRHGVAGIHIEDQLYPKRAHYHKYIVHGIPVEEFVDKIKFACKQRDESDPDFVIIAARLRAEPRQSRRATNHPQAGSTTNGLRGCIEAQVVLCTAHHFLKKALTELRETGDYTGMTPADYVTARQEVEDLISLNEYYEVEAQTVEAPIQPAPSGVRSR